MVKAVVLGAAGGIGQPLSLLLKLNPDITELRLYDIVNAPGVAVDLSHINTPAKVEGYLPSKDCPENSNLKKALNGAEVVIIPAGVPRKPGMTRDDLFKINAGIVHDLASHIADVAPKAFILVISNPVNSTVPIVAEVFKKKNCFDPKRIFGVTTLDVVRASTFVADSVGCASGLVTVPVVGGHSGSTIVPLLSKSSHPLPNDVSEETLKNLVHRIQYGGDEVVQAKDGAGSATLSMAYAGAEFAKNVILAIKGDKNIIVPSYINLTADPEGSKEIQNLDGELHYFSCLVRLSQDGVKAIEKWGEITTAERDLLKVAIPALKVNIEQGESFIPAPKL